MMGLAKTSVDDVTLVFVAAETGLLQYSTVSLHPVSKFIEFNLVLI